MPTPLGYIGAPQQPMAPPAAVSLPPMTAPNTPVPMANVVRQSMPMQQNKMMDGSPGTSNALGLLGAGSPYGTTGQY